MYKNLVFQKPCTTIYRLTCTKNWVQNFREKCTEILASIAHFNLILSHDLMNSEGRFFPLFESFTNRRKTRGKEKRRGNENRWYLDLNNPQLILRKYHTSGTRNQPVVAVAAVAEFYGTRFPFLSPFVAFLLRFSVVL